MSENPYLIFEHYVGDSDTDYIGFKTVDNGILPKPNLGIANLFDPDSKERFRALCVDRLKRDFVNTFISSDVVIRDINIQQEHTPEWKRCTFNTNYFNVDKDFIDENIMSRKHNDKTYLYLKENYEHEALIRSTLKDLLQRPNIEFKKELKTDDFRDLLREESSELFKNVPSDYEKAISEQAAICSKIFNKPLCVISGAAGTGKTTIIKSLCNMIKKIHGRGSSLFIVAPTGKASERLKERTGLTASTIHSLLAKNGWLNENLSFKRTGGTVEKDINTLIIDESSMVDLELFAALFRAVDFNYVQRLILVGDPNQLPPIGKGKVFSDVFEYLKKNHPDNLAVLQTNMRHMENVVINRGNGILDLAQIFIQENQDNPDFKPIAEQTLKLIQNGGDIDKDLKVIYWKDQSDLEALVTETLIADLKSISGKSSADLKELWIDVNTKSGFIKNPHFFQILSPFRGELFGTENINTFMQKLVNGGWFERYPNLGITLFDKVIQIRNRTRSNPIQAWDTKLGAVDTEVFNGELGFVKPHALDKSNWKGGYFWFKRFQVVFERKENLWVGYGIETGFRYGRPQTESIEENLELAYAISIHKAQGSEFERVYCIVPNKKSAFVSMELLYTAITRAKRHLTLFIQDDISFVSSLRRFENSALRRINSSIFKFEPLPDILYDTTNWYTEGKIISTLTDYFVRSKSEMNIANILHLNNIPFKYEIPLFAEDGSMYLPDFTINWKGQTYYWEHLGRLDIENYKEHWKKKKEWYDKNFPGTLIVTHEGPSQTKEIQRILETKFQIKVN